MFDAVPKLGESLSDTQLALLRAFAKSGRHTAIAMLKQSQSGHPGGSLSAMDYLAALYAYIVSQTGNTVVISNGHISPGIYAVLAELGYLPKQRVIDTFRRPDDVYEGHITRHAPGVFYGTGPLGIGTSVATGAALAEKLKQTDGKVYGMLGDGEFQEGQVHEMMHFARKFALNNLVMFVDYNAVQLSDSIDEIMPVNIAAHFRAADWRVLEIDGHDFTAIWDALHTAEQETEKPVVIIGRTVMGQGVDFMEVEGKAHRATWHGNAPKPEQADEALKQLSLDQTETALLEAFRDHIRWTPPAVHFTPPLTVDTSLDIGQPILYPAGTKTDCRSAYGKALLDLAQRNDNVLALTADLRGSVKTDGVHDALPKQHIECGIAEQQMVSVAGGLSLSGFVPFASTFGAFMTSRAKDQARVNDINQTNVKMVATHCGLSVGEDGPTHQAIDDSGSMLGLLHTMQIEPVDANHTDRIIRYIASHYGNFYVRMGRHKFNVLTDENGDVIYGEDYAYVYGKCDRIRVGRDITVVAMGPMVTEALKAYEDLKNRQPELSVEIIAASSIKQFDDTLLESIRKTGRVLTVEDHNPYSGLGGQLARHLLANGVEVKSYKHLGVEAYQLSGVPDELYESAGISAKFIAAACIDLTNPVN